MANYFFGYKPLNKELNTQIYENYSLISVQKEMRIEQHLDKSIEGTMSLSSRTMIRNAIYDYHEGNISFEELVIYTQSRYEDGVDVLHDIVYAIRVVDGMVIAKVNEPFDSLNLKDLENVNTATYDIIIQDSIVCVVVVSPITYDNQVIGHDIATYNMTHLIEEFNEDNEVLNIIDFETRNEIIANSKIIVDNPDYSLLLKDGNIVYVSGGLLNSHNTFISNTVAKDILESEIRVLTNQNLIGTTTLIILSIIIVLLISVKNSNKKLNTSRKKSKYFQDLANKDALTDVYTRHYFEFWQNDFENRFDATMKPIAVVMSDVNKFKKFNDTYGHKAGDEALRNISNIMKDSIREQDLIIRYGGDEFLFIFVQCDKVLCDIIMKRINYKITKDSRLKDISLAYGYVIVDQPSDIENSIEIADQKMYEHKLKINKL